MTLREFFYEVFFESVKLKLFVTLILFLFTIFFGLEFMNFIQTDANKPSPELLALGVFLAWPGFLVSMLLSWLDIRLAGWILMLIVVFPILLYQYFLYSLIYQIILLIVRKSTS